MTESSVTTEPAVFAIQRKLLVTGMLIYAGIFLVLVAFGIYILTSTDSSTSFIGLFFAGFGVGVGISAMTRVNTVLDPPRLQVDGDGLVMSAGFRRCRILWSQVEEIRIIHFQPLPNARWEKIWLMVWPRSEWSVTRGGAFLPQWRKEFSGLKVCNLRLFGAPAELEVSKAVARFAGELWNESMEPR